MHIWNPAAAAAVVRASALRPCVFGSRLYYRDATSLTEITGTTQPDGTVQFAVTRAQVTAVKSNAAYLFITTRHVLHPGAPDLRWGWRYQVAQGNRRLRATDSDGTLLNLDAQGYLRSPLEPFDEQVEIGRETIAFT